jgi:hypothetical protein
MPWRRGYFGVLLADPHDAEAAFQKFYLRMVEPGTRHVQPPRPPVRDRTRRWCFAAVQHRKDVAPRSGG